MPEEKTYSCTTRKDLIISSDAMCFRWMTDSELTDDVIQDGFAVWTQNVLLGAIVVWRNVIRKMDKKRTTLNETWYWQENVSNPTPNTSPYRSESHCRNIGSMKSLYTSSAPPSLGIMSQTRKTSAPSQWILTIFLGPDSFGREN